MAPKGLMSLSVHVVEPRFVLGILALDNLVELSVDLRGDLSGFSVSDDTSVDGGHGCNLSGGAGHPDLVSGGELEPGNGGLDDFVTEVPCNGDDGSPGDTLEDSLGDGRGIDLAELVEEDVLSGTLGGTSFLVQHECFAGALADGFPLSKAGSNVGSVDLGSSGTAQVVGPLPGCGDELGSLCCPLSQVCTHVDAGDGETLGDADGIESDLLSAEEDAGLDIIDLLVGPDSLFDCFGDALLIVLLSAELHLEAEEFATVDEPADVVLEPEDCGTLGGLVDPDSLEHSGSVVEGVGQNMDPCLIPVDKFAVEPNLLAFLSHWITFVSKCIECLNVFVGFRTGDDLLDLIGTSDDSNVSVGSRNKCVCGLAGLGDELRVVNVLELLKPSDGQFGLVLVDDGEDHP